MITFYQNCLLFETGRDGYGNYVEKNKRYLKCRVKDKVQLVKDKAAKEVVSKLEIWLHKDTEIKVDDQIKILVDGVDEEKTQSHTIISLKNKRNTLGEIVRKVVYI